MDSLDARLVPVWGDGVSGPGTDDSAGASYAPPATVLTRRQREVVALVTQGYTNQQIADELVLTAGTAANHVQQILDRLGVASRTQAAAWAVERGLVTTQDRLLTALERLLEIQAATPTAATADAAQIVLELLGADKVDLFLHDPETDTLVAAGVSNTAMGRKQRAIGLDHQPVANGGRAVAVFQSGLPHRDGRVDQDPDELVGIKRGLGVRSQIGVALDVAGVRRGALFVQSATAEFFSERDLRFLQAVSHWVGSVVQRAELTEQLTAGARERGQRAAAEELVTVLAHDLGNHLAPLMIRQELVRRRARRDERPDNLRDADETLSGLQRLRGLITDLLDTARLEQGLFTLESQPVDLAALARETAARFTTAATSRPIDVQTLQEVVIFADPARLRQALENLLANALKHTPVDTAVTLTVGAEERDGQSWAVLSVADQGPGIPPELLPRLFDRFTSGSGSGGLGLGLYLAHGIARAHGGELTVHSTAGQGARFDFAVPAQELDGSETDGRLDGAAQQGDGSL